MGKNNIFELHNHLYTFLESKDSTFRFKEFLFSLNNGVEQK
jgi:hypothetical protein